MRAINPSEENRRQQYLDRLYELDGRMDRQHPDYGIYTGLFQGRVEQLIKQDRRQLVGEP